MFADLTLYPQLGLCQIMYKLYHADTEIQSGRDQIYSGTFKLQVVFVPKARGLEHVLFA